MTAALQAHGISVALQPGWDVRITMRDQSDILVPGPVPVPISGYVRPVVHAATITMPPLKGDYGSHVVPLLGLADVFVCLAEFDPEAGASAMFRPSRPRLRSRDFDRAALQRALPNRCGAQYFFAERGRAFCLFCVLGSYTRRASLMKRAADFFAGMEVEPR